MVGLFESRFNEVSHFVMSLKSTLTQGSIPLPHPPVDLSKKPCQSFVRLSSEGSFRLLTGVSEDRFGSSAKVFEGRKEARLETAEVLLKVELWVIFYFLHF